MSEPLGETIASDSQVLEVECHRLYGAPAFGSFVRAACPSGFCQFAVVTHVSTGPFDGNRVVQAHRLAPGELEERKPHLTSLLRTLFQARVIGYGDDNARVAGTPPLPARLHCFVYPATAEEIRAITASPSFLRPLVQTPNAPLEDLLVGAIRSAQEAWGSGERLVAWGKYLARLLHQDYVTLEGVMHRLSPAPMPAYSIAPAPSPSAHPRWEKPLPLSGNGKRGDRDPFED